MLKSDLKVLNEVKDLINNIYEYGLFNSFSHMVDLVDSAPNIESSLEELLFDLPEETRTLFILHPLYGDSLGVFTSIRKTKIFIRIAKSMCKYWLGDELQLTNVVTILKKYKLYDKCMANLFTYSYINTHSFDKYCANDLLNRLLSVYKFIMNKTEMIYSNQLHIKFSNFEIWDTRDMMMSFYEASSKYGNNYSVYGSEFIVCYDYNGILENENLSEWDVKKCGGDIKEFFATKLPWIIDELDQFMKQHEQYYLDNPADLESNFFYGLTPVMDTLKINLVYDTDNSDADYYLVNDIRDHLQVVIKINQIQKTLKEIVYTAIHVLDVSKVLELIMECMLQGIASSVIGTYEEVVDCDTSKCIISGGYR